LHLTISICHAIFGKIWTRSLRGCFITVTEVEMHPYTFARSRKKVCQLPMWDLQSLDFIVNIFLWNCFEQTINNCMLNFELPSITQQKRSEKFEMQHCTVETVLIKFN